MYKVYYIVTLKAKYFSKLQQATVNSPAVKRAEVPSDPARKGGGVLPYTGYTGTYVPL